MARTFERCELQRRNDAMAALIGCPILSGFFARYEFGKKAIRTLAALVASKTGKIARRPVPGERLIRRRYDVEDWWISSLGSAKSDVLLGSVCPSERVYKGAEVGVKQRWRAQKVGGWVYLRFRWGRGRGAIVE
jgi:hypothetical protein